MSQCSLHAWSREGRRGPSLPAPVASGHSRPPGPKGCFLYFSDWLHGDLCQYDISDRANPKATGPTHSV